MTKKLIKGHESVDLSQKERDALIKKGAKQFGKFLTALGYDWENDPHFKDTPNRFTKAWVNELMIGNFSASPRTTSFQEEDSQFKKDTLVVQKNIEIKSKCSHHLESITGVAFIAYLPSKEGNLIGLSKLNRIADWVSRKPQVQERLTIQIHDEVSKMIPDNQGVAVYVSCKHGCVSCRGINQDSSMDTIHISGEFHNPSMKEEFLFAISNNFIKAK